MDWAITAFVDAHPEWKSSKSELTANQEGDGWHYIYFHGSRIGRVKVGKKDIVAESFVSK